MTWKDTLEIGLKDDAPFRRDNLPDFQVEPNGPETQPGDPTRSPEEPGAREDAEEAAEVRPQAEPATSEPDCCLNEPPVARSPELTAAEQRDLVEYLGSR